MARPLHRGPEIAVADHDHLHVAHAVQITRPPGLGRTDAHDLVAGGEPFGKAGAYAIQGPISGWIAHIAGSYTGIMGLPLFETAALLDAALRRFGGERRVLRRVARGAARAGRPASPAHRLPAIP